MNHSVILKRKIECIKKRHRLISMASVVYVVFIFNNTGYHF